jgi:acetyltransferase
VDEAVAWAEKIGYPVVLKLYSLTITHKTDVGGVVLNLRDAAQVREAFTGIQQAVAEKVGAQHFQGVTVQPMAKLEGYELILGASLDPQFGPVLLFGTGGQLVEVFKDKSLALPPLNSTLARRMMETTKIYHALQGVRGRKSVDLAALENLLVRFSDLVVENPRIKEVDINPLLASPDRLLALDARVVLHEAEVTDDKLPRSAIRPYPEQYVAKWKTNKGAEVTIRPIRPEDEPLLVEFHRALSERSVLQRYFQPLQFSQRTAHERLTRICFIDYNREMALVVEQNNAKGEAEIVAIGRMSKQHGVPDADLAALVRDESQGQGLGQELYRRLVQVARAEKLTRLHSNMLSDNVHGKAMCQALGFKILEQSREDNLLLVELAL